MTLPRIVSRDEWLAARQELLVREKELTRQHDAVSRQTRELPMVEVETGYRLEGAQGPAGLADLFQGRRQLIVYHFMFAPDWDEGCPSCTAGTDEVSPGLLRHLAERDTSYAMVSLAPRAKLAAYSARRGWDHIPWYSSGGTSFNSDFEVTVDEAAGADRYNFRSRADFADLGQDGFYDSPQPFELHGRSCFLSAAGRVFHTYSQYARGLECTGGSYYFLDLTALGRQEDWEEPKGRAESARAGVPDFDT